MIFDDLQQAIVDQLLSDAWFADPDARVPVIKVQPKDIKNEYDIAIAKLGSVAIVGRPELHETEGVDRIRIDIGLDFAENVTLNRGPKGVQKPNIYSAVKALALIRGWSPGDIWADFYFQDLTPLGQDEDGCDHYLLNVYTFTHLELLVTVLGTERDTIIGPDTNTAFEVSPTPA